MEGIRMSILICQLPGDNSLTGTSKPWQVDELDWAWMPAVFVTVREAGPVKVSLQVPLAATVSMSVLICKVVPFWLAAVMVAGTVSTGVTVSVGALVVGVVLALALEFESVILEVAVLAGCDLLLEDVEVGVVAIGVEGFK